jgi:hypothetical protein
MAEIQILGDCRQLVSNPVGTDYADRKAQNFGWRWIAGDTPRIRIWGDLFFGLRLGDAGSSLVTIACQANHILEF